MGSLVTLVSKCGDLLPMTSVLRYDTVLGLTSAVGPIIISIRCHWCSEHSKISRRKHCCRGAWCDGGTLILLLLVIFVLLLMLLGQPATCQSMNIFVNC